MRWTPNIPEHGNTTEWKEHFCIFPTYCEDVEQTIWLEWCYKRKVYNLHGYWISEYKLGDLK